MVRQRKTTKTTSEAAQNNQKQRVTHSSEAAQNNQSNEDEPAESETNEATDSDTEDASESIPDIAGATEVTVTVPTKDLSVCLRLAQCLTYSACQSRTLSGRLRLWDVGHIHFTKRHLNVGLSRGTSCSLIDLGD